MSWLPWNLGGELFEGKGETQPGSVPPTRRSLCSRSAIGCVFTVPAKPQPCVTTRWIVGAARVTSNGIPLLINPCVAICQSVEQIPAGPPIITGSQTRVVAT